MLPLKNVKGTKEYFVTLKYCSELLVNFLVNCFTINLICRESLSAQLDLTMTKAESEQLARALQEEQYFELSQENKKAVSRYKQEITEKDSTMTQVCAAHTLLLVKDRRLSLNLISFIFHHIFSIRTLLPGFTDKA